MLTGLDKVLNKGVGIYRNKLVRVLVQLVVLAVCVFYIYRYSNEIINITKQLQVDFIRIIIACLILCFIYILIGTTSWWCILKGLGEDPNWINSAHIQMNSTLAKYIPGYIWQYVGKAVLSKEIGINSAVSGLAMAFELIQTLLIGIGLACLAYANQAVLKIDNINLRSIALPLGLFIIIVSWASLWIIPRMLPRSLQIKSYRPRYLVASLLLITIGWFLLSLSYWLLGTSLTSSITSQDYVLFILTTAAAMTIGILVVLVPNGLGVREGVMVMVLGTTIGIPLAIVFATSTRLFVTVSELASAFIIGLIYRNSARKTQDIAGGNLKT